MDVPELFKTKCTIEYIFGLRFYLLIFLYAIIITQYLGFYFEVWNGIRLVGGNEYSGRLEVKSEGRWGTVCNRRWGTRDADVACKQLGFDRSNRTITRVCTKMSFILN